MISRVRTLYLLSLLLAALALVPAGAHLAELFHKMRFDAEDYRTVQQIYRGWALFGIVVFSALAVTLTLTIRLRGASSAFKPALVGLLFLIGTQVIFWTFTFPVNQATSHWTVLPPNWIDLRARWEYSHAASALLNLGALVALIVSVLRYGDVR